MKIILLGPPGAGKGTQAELICKELGIPHISTGDMLRAAIAQGDDFGMSIKATVDSGQFVSDDTIIELVRRRIAQTDCKQGFILDGFPRTPIQAESLSKAKIGIDYVVVINVPDNVIVKRLSGRRIHLDSGRIYHIDNHPPKVEGIDDLTGEPLIMRQDDDEATVKDRLAVYHKKTEPLVAWYKDYQEKHAATKVLSVDGTQDAEQVCEDILSMMRNGTTAVSST